MRASKRQLPAAAAAPASAPLHVRMLGYAQVNACPARKHLVNFGKFTAVGYYCAEYKASMGG